MRSQVRAVRGASQVSGTPHPERRIRMGASHLDRLEKPHKPSRAARRSLGTAVVRGLESLEARQLPPGGPVINESLASTDNSAVSEDFGPRQEWGDLYNPAAATIDLTNWHLTDKKGTPA